MVFFHDLARVVAFWVPCHVLGVKFWVLRRVFQSERDCIEVKIQMYLANELDKTLVFPTK